MFSDKEAKKRISTTDYHKRSNNKTLNNCEVVFNGRRSSIQAIC